MVKPVYATGIRSQVPTKENEFESKGALKTVELQGLPVGAKEPCGQYVCVTDLSGVKLNGDFQCTSFKGDRFKETTCKNMVRAYFWGDQYYRRLDSELGLDINILRGAPTFAAVVRHMKNHNSGRVMPIFLNDTSIPHNAAYNPFSRDITIGSSESKDWPESLDGDILFHELQHATGDFINPLLAEYGYYSPAMTFHEGTLADGGTALMNNDPQIGEGFANAAAGLRTVNNTRTFWNMTVYDASLSQIGDPHDVSKIYSGFGWSIHLKFCQMLKEKNPTLSPEEIAKLSSKAVGRMGLYATDAYKTPNPMHNDFLYRVIDGIETLVKENMIEEFTNFGIDKNAMINVVKAEAQKRGFYYIATIEKKEAPGSTQQKNLTLGVEIKLPTLQGGTKVFRQQYYNTKKNGPALVVGHGTIELRKGAHNKMSAEGIRGIDAARFDETVSVNNVTAWKRAIQDVGPKISSAFAKRPADAPVSKGTELKLILETQEKLKSNSFECAQLAILPRGDHLVWLFDTENVRVAVSAKSGAVEEVSLRKMID